jgi:tetratricopeptide (TPR) repeat protein
VRLDRERQAVAETRAVAEQRLQQAAEAIASGNYPLAQDLLRWSDPALERYSDLGAIRAELATLKAQVDVYAEFKSLLDSARFACRFGSRQQQELGRGYCVRLLALYDGIEGLQGAVAAGLPPLNAEQQQLFKEDVFEAFLTAAQVEQNFAGSAGPDAQKRAAQQAIDWLGRAEQILPGTRALYVHRAQCWAKLGNSEAERADLERARAINPTSAVDRFWHGYANHVRGDEARRKGDSRAAQDFYRKEVAEYAAFLQQRPEHYWGYFNWANCMVQLGDLHNASIGFTACIRLRPDFPWPYNNRGTVHLRLGQYEQAVADYSTALERSSEYAQAYANRGAAYLAWGKSDLALKDLNQALTLDPKYAGAHEQRADVYRARRQYEEALHDYDQFKALGGDKLQVHLKKADTYRQMTRLDDAIKEYGLALAINDKNVQAYYARAGLHLARGKYREAVDDYSRVIDLAPRAAGIHEVIRTRAIVTWFNLKDFDASLADWKRLAQLRPKDAEPHRRIAVIRLGRRQYDQALHELQSALTLKPDDTEATWARAQVYLWQGKLKEALGELDPVVAYLPLDKPETLNLRGDVYKAMGRLEKAAADYSRMIELKPKDSEAYVSLARVRQKQGQPEKAAGCLDRLVAAAPDSEWAYLRRAEYRRDQGNYDEALADCDRTEQLKPGWALAALVRASVVAARGQPRAMAEAERALEKAPKHDGHVLYTAACAWSLASRTTADPADARRAADRATDLLAEALDKGFHDLNFSAHNRMADDPALAPIRKLPRVRDLLAHKP